MKKGAAPTRLPNHVVVALANAVRGVTQKGRGATVECSGPRAEALINAMLSGAGSGAGMIVLRDSSTGIHLFQLDVDQLDDSEAVLG